MNEILSALRPRCVQPSKRRIFHSTIRIFQEEIRFIRHIHFLQSPTFWHRKINEHPTSQTDAIKLCTCSFFLWEILGFGLYYPQHLHPWNDSVVTAHEYHVRMRFQGRCAKRLIDEEQAQRHVQGLNCPRRNTKPRMDPKGFCWTAPAAWLAFVLPELKLYFN